MLAKKLETMRRVPKILRDFGHDLCGATRWLARRNDAGQLNVAEVARQTPKVYLRKSFAVAALSAAMMGAASGTILAFKMARHDVQGGALRADIEALKDHLPLAPLPPFSEKMEQDLTAIWNRVHLAPAMARGAGLAVLLTLLVVPVTLAHDGYKGKGPKP
jgi:hypothetical protein